MRSDLKIALVHDWLTGMRGGEKVLEALCELYPQAPLFTLVHNPGSVAPVIEARKIHTSFIDRLPLKAKRYRNYLPLFPRAIEAFDFSEYDLILSTSHAVAKGARPRPGALHICYCHTPMRYVWELYDQYFGPGRGNLLTRAAMSYFAPRLRSWDVATSGRVHAFAANSRNVAERIRRYYDRSAQVIYPPVNTAQFTVSENDDGYYLIVSALVPYKRVDLAVEAFNRTGDRLLVVGTGPEMNNLASAAAKNIEFLGWQSDSELPKLYARCRALIFPGIEDFGIVPLEAMASGKPVVAFAMGGALETVVDDPRSPTGVFFQRQTPEALIDALTRLRQLKLDPHAIRAHAERFDRGTFRENYRKYVEQVLDQSDS
jgi:glycosyltransferase involved in cell wall biosynthesis